MEAYLNNMHLFPKFLLIALTLKPIIKNNEAILIKQYLRSC